MLGLNIPQVWTFDMAFKHLQKLGVVDNKPASESKLQALQLIPPALKAESLRDEMGRPANLVVLSWAIEQAHSQDQQVLFVQLHDLPNGEVCLHANDPSGHRYWYPLGTDKLDRESVHLLEALGNLHRHIGKNIALFPHGEATALLRGACPPEGITLTPSVYLPVLELQNHDVAPTGPLTPHLKRLESESIHIIREAVAEADHPVMLYSIGKDSAVMLHLARKAFYPAPPPFPLMHVDTRWKFQEMYLFRDHMAQQSGMDLLVHINPDAISKDINPFDHGSAMHTDITKTEGLKQALDKYQFDVIFGGARRDEEKSRAKERIFSFRSQSHQWDPKQQRPELWNLFNTRKNKGESIRVFPLSNWTELDIWQYIYQQNIPVVPLYFAKKRPVVVRNGMILLVDDGRFRLVPGEKIIEKVVRFRTLGCYPLTGAIESTASSLPEIILELINARSSERQGRAIDSDASSSMEKRRKKGTFDGTHDFRKQQ